MKKFLSILLTLSMILAMSPLTTVSVSAAETQVSVGTTEELQTALDNATEGTKIVLAEGEYGIVYLRNNGAESNRIMKDVTIIAADDADVKIEQIANDEVSLKTLDIENLTIDGLNFSNPAHTGINFEANSRLRVNGLTVQNCSKTGNGQPSGGKYDDGYFLGLQYGGPTAVGTKFSGDNTLNCGYSNIVVTGNTFNNVYQPIASPNDGPIYGITITGNTFNKCQNNHIQISGPVAGTFTASNNTIIDMTGRFARISGGIAESVFVMENNTITTPRKYDTGGDPDVFKITGEAGFTVTESGNEWTTIGFNTDNTKWLAEGIKDKLVAPEEAVCIVLDSKGNPYDAPGTETGDLGAGYYDSLQAAFGLIPTDDTYTVKMLKDVTIEGNAGASIAANQKIVLDLNGKTVGNYVTDNGESQTLYNYGTLTIEDSTDEDKDGTGEGLLTNAAKPGTEVGEWWKDPKNNYWTNVITNRGTLTVNSGKIENTCMGSICFCVDNLLSTDGGTGSTMNLNGGLITRDNGSVIRIYNWGTSAALNFNMTGGYITGGYRGIYIHFASDVNCAANVNISGGEVDCTTGLYSYYKGTSMENCYVKITDGIISGIYLGSANLDISGGTFTRKVELESYYADYTKDAKISISGGVFEDEVKVTQYSSISPFEFITGGTFDTLSNAYLWTTYVDAKGDCYDREKGGYVATTEYSSVKAYVEAGYTVTYTDWDYYGLPGQTEDDYIACYTATKGDETIELFDDYYGGYYWGEQVSQSYTVGYNFKQCDKGYASLDQWKDFEHIVGEKYDDTYTIYYFYKANSIVYHDNYLADNYCGVDNGDGTYDVVPAFAKGYCYSNYGYDSQSETYVKGDTTYRYSGHLYKDIASAVVDVAKYSDEFKLFYKIDDIDDSELEVELTGNSNESFLLPVGVVFVVPKTLSYTGTISAPEGYIVSHNEDAENDYYYDTFEIPDIPEIPYDEGQNTDFKPTDEYVEVGGEEVEVPNIKVNGYSSTSTTETKQVAAEVRVDIQENENVNEFVDVNINDSLIDKSEGKDHDQRVEVVLTSILAKESKEYTETEETITAVYSKEFYVKPMYLKDDGSWEIINNRDITGEITFRLPVNNKITKSAVAVYHRDEKSSPEDEELVGILPVEGDYETGRYVELSASKFSFYRIEVLTKSVTDTIVVNESWADSKEYAEKITIDGIEYFYGVNAFAQMSDAVDSIKTTPKTILVLEGNVGTSESEAGEGSEFTVAGTYNVSGTKWANLGYLQLNPDKITSETRYVLNIDNSNLVVTKPQLRGSSDLNITNSHVDLAMQSAASCGYLFAFKDSVVKVENSVLGYYTGNGNSSEVEPGETSEKTQGYMSTWIYGSFNATDSTVFAFGGDTGINAFTLLDKGRATFTDSVLYSHAIIVGSYENRTDRDTVGYDGNATLTLNNSQVYANNGYGYGLKVGDTKAGDVVMTGSSINYSTLPVAISSNGTLSMDATSKITASKFTNAGTITVDMSGATATEVVLISGGADSSYGEADTSYAFAEGKDFGYALKVVDNKLIAYIPDVDDVQFYASLSLYESIDVNLIMNNFGATFVPGKLAVTVDGEPVELTVNEDGSVSGLLKALAPTELSTVLNVVVTYDGKALKSFEYSVSKYCKAVFDAGYDDTTSLGKLCIAVLNYGAYAERYVGKSSTLDAGCALDFSKINIPESHPIVKKGSTLFKAASASLTLGSKISINYFITTKVNLNMDNIKIINNLGEQVDKKNIEITAITGGYQITVKNIDFNKLSRTYKLITAYGYEDDFSVTYGVYTYCYEAQEQTDPVFTDTVKKLCKTIYNYGEMAKAYVEE